MGITGDAYGGAAIAICQKSYGKDRGCKKVACPGVTRCYGHCSETQKRTTQAKGYRPTEEEAADEEKKRAKVESQAAEDSNQKKRKALVASGSKQEGAKRRHVGGRVLPPLLPKASIANQENIANNGECSNAWKNLVVGLQVRLLNLVHASVMTVSEFLIVCHATEFQCSLPLTRRVYGVR